MRKAIIMGHCKGWMHPSKMKNALAMTNNAMAIIDDVIHNAFDGRRI
ncbi:MAG: hypothetical protein GY938_27275 [Ketobacter sp.]|nr:hypothetical protein [Ketobacter sp.]